MLLIHLFKTLLYLGYVDQARLRRDEALVEARKRSPYHLANVLCHAWHGDWAMEGEKFVGKTLSSADEILALSSEQGFPLTTGVGNIMRGWCLAKLGSAVEGIPLLLAGLAKCRDADCTAIVPFLLTTVADAYRMTGQLEPALDRLVEAEDLTEATQERWAEAETHRLRGTLLLATGKSHEAEERYHRALLVARQQAATFWELRAATNLARLWRDQGKRTEARDLLAPVYGWFTEGFDTPVLQDAKVLLNELM
jgi:predicted ATPase